MQKSITFIIFNFFVLISLAQNSINGKIVDENGDPAIGSTISIKGTTLGTTADISGNYQLDNIPNGTQTLVISFIGYKTINQTIIIGENDQLSYNATIFPENKLLDQVVVIGYGTQIKREISSSIVSLKSEELENKPNNNFSSSLQGKAAGVQITTDNGMAGAPTSIRIRGINTLSGGAEPLYVIDGVPILNEDISESANRFGYNTSPLALINPNDIEDITILKDASATAIYGSRGANGVILITTKSGKSGKPKININYNTGLSTETNRLEILNADQYVELYKQAWTNDGNDLEDLTHINGIHLDSIANTDWIDEVLQIGQFHDANLSYSGGNDVFNYYIGSSFKKQKTFIKGNEFQRATIKGTMSYNANEKLNIEANTSLGRTDNKYAKTGASGGLGRAQSEALPIYPVYNSDGSYYWWDNGGLQNLNPVAEANLLDNRNRSYRSLNNFNISYELNENIKLKNEFGLDIIDQNEKFYTPKEISLKVDSNGIALSSLEERKIEYTTWNYNSTIHFNKDYTKNKKLSFLGGYSTQHSVENYNYNRVSDPNLKFHSDTENALYQEFSINGKGQEYKNMSLFSRLNYSLYKKYLLQISYRTDGSSRFGSDNKFGHFGAISFGWIITDERFLKENNWLNFLKLRSSAGTRGNDNIGNFNQYSFYSSNQDYAGQDGIGPDNPSVSDLRWETVFTSDLGLDFGIFENRISGTLEYYYTHSSDVLISDSPLSPSSGYSSVTKNLGKVKSEGWELQITSHNLSPQSKFKWKTNFNISHYTNEVLDLGGVNEVAGTNYGENRAIVGQPVGVFFLAEFAGIDPETGEELIFDLEGNKVVLNATNSVSERKVMGKPYPDFYGGINNSFEYNRVGIDIFFVFNQGQMIYDDHGKRQLGNMGFGWNQDIRSLDYWEENGDITDVPTLSLTENRDINSSRHLYDASYIRLRNLSINYKLSEKICKKLNAVSLKIFLSAQNLAVWTKYKGWDPEVNREGSGAITQGVSYLSPPQAKTITTGINITF
ncbi:MAG: SusC/RagA family TonB-linked outer membrane protein [Flavobacteriales bacterium]|nr:MAG: SusC/RagA family TonB-linked outer membrane protein [Flavobacteriales bacterium]